MNTRDMIAEFQRAFGRPIHDTLQKDLSVEDRLLLGSILIEEVIETVTKGLGLVLSYSTDTMDGEFQVLDETAIKLVHLDGKYDLIEFADGLGDTNVVIHFNAHWAGMNLDRITQEINDSNMSKLAHDGTPIINGVTPGYEGSHDHVELADNGFRPDLPVGKILKGPNFRKPDIAAAIGLCAHVGCPLEGKPHRHSDSMEAGMANDNSMTRHGPRG